MRYVVKIVTTCRVAMGKFAVNKKSE